MKSLAAFAIALVGLPCWAQPAPVPAAAAAAPRVEAAERAEPSVRHTVIEDKGSKIEELNVRGQTQHVVVTPKVGLTKPYEIIVPVAGRDPFDGVGGPKSAAGKRVWSLVNF